MRLVNGCLVILTALAMSVNAAAAQSIKIGIPQRNNLQYMSFWIAQGAGLFKAEGLDIEIVVPHAPTRTAAAGRRNLFDADCYWEGFPEQGRNAHVTLRYAF